MSKATDVRQALELLTAQIADTNLDPKDRQSAARIVLTYHKESKRTYESTAKTDKQKSAVAAAERLTRVK
ncbi:hypothetical protein C84B14_08777 [Salinisphaera sp. C84B14]|uniref:hypothetical protein n=1 Tax=Salinisphaera sp. C84B14 TaxID=1304155 RepID=UPI0033427838